MKINVAVFPVAGLGTRFLPVTKVVPKEILPILDKPIIQYAVEEALAAGVRKLIFITPPYISAIKKYFDHNLELESVLEERHQSLLLEKINNILPRNVTCTFVIQSQPLGLGHAVLCAKDYIDDGPFAVLLPDNLIDEAPSGCLKNMLNIYNKTLANVITLNPVPREEISKYGIAAIGKQNASYAPIISLVEKPKMDDAPSNLSVIGRYLLSPRIFSILEQTTPDRLGEIQLTDAISSLLREEPVLGYFLKGKCYDCGNKYGYLQASIDYALKDPEISAQFQNYLLDFITKLKR